MKQGFKYILCSILIILCKSQIKENPVEIALDSNFRDSRIIIKSDSLKTEKISGKSLVLKITRYSDDKIKYNDKTYYLASNTFFYTDESKNKFLFSEYIYYSIVLEKGDNIKSLNKKKTLQAGVSYCGYMVETKIKYVITKNKIERKSQNEIIIYGKKGNHLYLII